MAARIDYQHATPPPCGTVQGYKRHIRLGQETCQPCRKAQNDYCRSRPQPVGQSPTRRYNTTPPSCGTKQGYRRHRYLNEDACRPCKTAYADAARQRRGIVLRECATPDCTATVRRSGACYCEQCHHDRPAAAVRRAHNRNRNNLRRIAALYTDITAEYELELRRQAHTCPLCGVRMTRTWRLPNSKELDHIIPINAGGTHTMGNVRIICRTCNLARPHDGSDYTGQPTLWSQDSITSNVPKPPPKNAAICQCGQPLPTSRRKPGNRICHTCLPPRQVQRYRGVPLTEDQRRDRAEQAATMREAGTKWREIARQLGFANEGAAHLAAQRHWRKNGIDKRTYVR